MFTLFIPVFARFGRSVLVQPDSPGLHPHSVASLDNNNLWVLGDTIYVVWTGDPDEDEDWDVYLSRSFDGGETWDHQQVNHESETAPHIQLDATMLLVPPDTIYVAFVDYRSGEDAPSQISLARSFDGGNSWVDYSDVWVNMDYPNYIEGTDPCDRPYPKLLYSTFDGVVYCLSYYGYIRLFISNNKGASFSYEGALCGASNFWSHDIPRIYTCELNDVGGFFCRANYNNRFTYTWRNNATDSWHSGHYDSDPPVYYPTPDYRWGLCSALSDTIDGNIFHLAWADRRSERYQIFYGHHWTFTGVGLYETDIVVSDFGFSDTFFSLSGSPNAYFPSMVVSSDGDSIIIVWEESRESGDLHQKHILMRRSIDGGNSWELPIIKVDDDVSGSDNILPSLRVGDDGTIYVLYMSNRVYGNYDIYLTKASYPSAPSSIAIDETTSTSILLSWDPTTFFLEDEYYLFKDGESLAVIIAFPDSDHFAYLDTGLEANAEYGYCIATVNAEFGASRDTNCIVAKTLLTIPDLLMPSDSAITNDGRVVFAWTPCTDSGVYDPIYHLVIVSSSGDTNIYLTNMPTDTVDLPDGIYQWFVYVTTASNYSHGSERRFLIVDTTPPHSPSWVYAREIGSSVTPSNPSPWSTSGNFEISWAPIEDMTGVVQGYGKLGECPDDPSDVDFLFPATSPDTIVYPMLPDGNNVLYIFFSDGAGNYSNCASVILRKDSEPPFGTFASAPRYTLPGSITVRWNEGEDSISGVAGYKLYVNYGSGWEVFVDTNSATRSVSVPVYEGDTIIFEATAVDSAGNEEVFLSAGECTTYVVYDLVTEPGPGTTTIMGPSRDTVSVSWYNAGEGLDYVFELGEDVSFSSLLIDSLLTDTILVLSSDLLEDYGISDGTYFFRVCLVMEDSIYCPTFAGYYRRLVVDFTPPAPPGSLIANGSNPSPWSNEPEFVIEWINPEDLSGVAKAWYKLGGLPSAWYDTTGTWEVDDSTLVTIIVDREGRNVLAIWLEDWAGNISIENVETVLLRYDCTPPTSRVIAVSDTVYADSIFITVCWSGIDSFSGIYRYELKYQGPISPLWTSVYEGSDTCATVPFELPLDSTTWYFEVAATDSAGNEEIFRGMAEDSILYEPSWIDDKIIPSKCFLSVAPNPFNASVSIRYFVEAPGQVSISMFTATGLKVDVIVDKSESPGVHMITWTPPDDIPSGIYFIRLKAGNQVITKRAVLIK